MELVEGESLDRLLASRHLDLPRALSLLDGVLAGLDAMHSTGIGHLDIKPSNVILRGPGEPVLVDFGLSGRTVRPGCGSLSFGAPEIWVGSPDGAPLSPLPADAYAAACLAFELVTGEALFPGGSELTAISSHLAHDGLPAALAALDGPGPRGALVSALSAALRRAPAMRCTVGELRRALRGLTPALGELRWPIAFRRPGLTRYRPPGTWLNEALS
jgi:serine/threonine protein kinase